MVRYLVCLTGASGAIYGLPLLEALASPAGPCPGAELHLVASEWAERVVREETGVSLEERVDALGRGRIERHDSGDLASPLSSGSFSLYGTVVAPCSLGTVGAIASGISSNIIYRAGAGPPKVIGRAQG